MKPLRGSVRIESKLGEVALLTDTSSSYSRETKSGSNVVWQSSRDKGESHQAIEHTEITAQGPVRIIAAKGVTVEYRDTGNVDDSITQLSKQPGLEWMAQLRADPKVDWRAVAEAHQSWDYKAEGLTGAGAALLTLAVAAATYGYGAKIAALFEGMAGQAALAAGAKAGFMALCGQASVALVNNKGDLLAALRDLGREASLKALASSILAAGLTAGALDLAELNEAQNLTTAEYLQNVAKETAIQGVVHAGVDTSLYGGNPGQNLLDGLRGAAASTLGADVAAKIGAAYKNGDLNYVTHKIAHAALGGAMGLATTGDAGAGAIGGAVGEMTAEAFVKGFTNKQLEYPENKKTLSEAELKELDADLKRMREFGVDLSKLSAGIAAALAGADVNTAAQAGGNAAENNCFFVIPIVLELVDKGLQLYDAYQLAKALEEGNTEEALKLSGIIAAGLATDAMPGNVVAIKLGLALKKFGLTKLGTRIIAKFGGEAGTLSKLVPGGGLAAHEAAGGHLLARHVAISDADLAARLASKSTLKDVSTFVTRTEAEAVVSHAIDLNAAKIEAWLASGAPGRLRFEAPITCGRVLSQGASSSVQGTGVKIVLEGTGNGGWRIVTGYPIK